MLRHAYAASAAGALETTAQRMAFPGWRSARTADRYVHRDALDLTSVVDAMGQAKDQIRGSGRKRRENSA